MNTSQNILKIKSLDIGVPELSDAVLVIRYRAQLHAAIEFLNPRNGNRLMRMNLRSDGIGCNPEAAAADAVQLFLNGNSYKTIDNPSAFTTGEDWHDVTINRREIHFVDVQMPEPFAAFFNDLFDLSKWQMPVKELEEVLVHG